MIQEQLWVKLLAPSHDEMVPNCTSNHIIYRIQKNKGGKPVSLKNIFDGAVEIINIFKSQPFEHTF
jgi:hypothetical protein